MSQPIPLQQLVAGTGGGIEGAVKRFLLLDPNIQTWFNADSIQPGKLRPPATTGAPAGTKDFPAIVLLGPDADSLPDSDRMLCLRQHLALSLYAIGCATTKWLGEYIVTTLLNAHDTIVYNHFGHTLILDGGVHFGIDPEPSDAGGDVYKYDARFLTITGIRLR